MPVMKKYKRLAAENENNTNVKNDENTDDDDLVVGMSDGIRRGDV